MAVKWVKSKNSIQINTKLNTYAALDGEKIEKIVIAMHGYGDNAENSSHIARAFDMKNILFLFIEGPRKVPMMLGGFQWFDLFHNPHAHIDKSAELVLDLYKELTQNHKFEPHQIYFFGFSQGAAMAMYCGLSTKDKIGGILSFSGFLAHTAQLLEQQDSFYKDCPILLMHGDQDQTIFPILFFEAEAILKHMKFTNVRKNLYSIGHTISAEQIEESKRFLMNKGEN